MNIHISCLGRVELDLNIKRYILKKRVSDSFTGHNKTQTMTSSHCFIQQTDLKIGVGNGSTQKACYRAMVGKKNRMDMSSLFL